MPRDDLKDIIKSSKDLFGDCDEKISKNDEYIQYLEQYRKSKHTEDFDDVSVNSGYNLRQFRGNSQVSFHVRTSKSPMRSNHARISKPNSIEPAFKYSRVSPIHNKAF